MKVTLGRSHSYLMDSHSHRAAELIHSIKDQHTRTHSDGCYERLTDAMKVRQLLRITITLGWTVT